MQAMRVLRIAVSRLLVFALVSTDVTAHSWVEQLMVIAPNGTFVGAPGYPRGNVLRTDPAFNDKTMTYLIPPDGRANLSQILPSDRLCKDTQKKQVQSDGSPRLQASPGAAIALRFQENGHVTLPHNQPGKPRNRGTIYVYGTTEPKEDERLLNVHKVWNKEGTGGDGRGVLLSVQNFDDGRCYQINSGHISEHRQAAYPHEANQLMGADLWCQQDIALPSEAPTGKPYTLYWVWDWPTAPGVDPSLPSGKQEIYTTCMDVDVLDGPPTHVRIPVNYVHDQSLNNAAIPSQFAQVFGLGGSSFSAPDSSTSRLIPTPTAVPKQPTPATVTSFITVTTTVKPYASTPATVTSFITLTTTVQPNARQTGLGSSAPSSSTPRFSAPAWNWYRRPI